jgi:transcriptional regulator with XRE-family HTH domain
MEKGREGKDRIKKLRQRLGLSQEEFARDWCGSSRSAESSWELGTNAVPAEVWLKLVPFMESSAEIKASLGLVHLDESAVLRAAEAVAKIPLVPLGQGKGIAVRPLKERGQQHREPSRRFSLSGCRISDPASVRYFRIDERSDGYGLEIGDVLLLDVSHADSVSLAPFWDQLMLYQLYEELYSDGKGTKDQYLLGYLILREERLQPRGQSVYTAEIKPWIGADFRPRKMGSSLPPYESFIYTHRLYKTRPVFENHGSWGFPIGTWRGESNPAIELLPGDGSAMPDVVKHALSEVRADPWKGRVLGRVIGWFRGRSKVPK